MITRSLAVLLIVCISCKPAPAKRDQSAAGEPQVGATVITIRTIIEPAKKEFQHTITIAGDKARSSDELDSWRLFDLKANKVTYVDDVAKTQRTAAVVPAPQLPEGATLSATGAKRAMHGVEAVQTVITAGGYRRELWIGQHPAIPPALFALMQTDPALSQVRGFPLADRAELPYGKGKLVIDRSVVKIERRQVPRSALAVPAGYRDTGAPPPPAAPRATPKKGR